MNTTLVCDCFGLQGLARGMQCSAIVAALVCLLVVLFQLNGRIAADPGPLIQGDVAPFEWAGALRWEQRHAACRELHPTL